MAELTKEERHVMEHATGWRTKQPLYRNHFVTGEGTPDYPIIQRLCERGWMRQTRGPSELSGWDAVFAVTDAGIEALRRRPSAQEQAPAAGGKGGGDG